MKDLILVGKQGAGKGTMAKFLIEEFDYANFETGAELRNIAKQETELGQKVKEITTRGDLVPNEIVMEIVSEFLKNVPAETPVIFDGIPRSEIQRKTLEEELSKAKREFVALELRLSNEEGVRRLLIRGKCNDCGTNFGGDKCPNCDSSDITRRADDNETAIRRRLENFEEYTAPLLAIWKSADNLLSVDAQQSVEKILNDIKKQLRNI